MISQVDTIRQGYNQIKNLVKANKLTKIKLNDVKRYQSQSANQLTRMQATQNFDNLHQIDTYNQTFKQLIPLIQSKNTNSISDKNYQTRISQLFNQHPSSTKNTYLNQPPSDPKITGQPLIQNQKLQSFFDQKRSRIMPDVGFKSLLENPPVSNRNFKRRIGGNNEQIIRLRGENQILKRQIGTTRSQNNDNLQTQIRRQEQRIRDLQSQNDRLSRDNTKLKSQRSVIAYSASHDDYTFSPYTIYPLENDLQKISMRNGSDLDSRSYVNQYFDNVNDGNNHNVINNEYNQFNLPSFGNKQFIKLNNYQTASEIADHQKNKDNYSIFEGSQSQYLQYGTQDDNFNRQSNNQGIDDPQIALHNKIAFFKNSGLIVRDQDFEIGYKRSQANNLLSNRIILYFNNKSNKNKNITVDYSYEQQYFQINIQQKLTEIPAFKQARQVIQINLRSQKQDINSLILTTITYNNIQRKLWLPTMFLKFSRPRQGMTEPLDRKTKTVNLSKLFLNETIAQKLMPMLGTRRQGEAYLWVQSGRHEGPAKITWKTRNRVEVVTSGKWIDFLAFLMFEYR